MSTTARPLHGDKKMEIGYRNRKLLKLQNLKDGMNKNDLHRINYSRGQKALTTFELIIFVVATRCHATVLPILLAFSCLTSAFHVDSKFQYFFKKFCAILL